LKHHEQWAPARIERTEDLTRSVRQFELEPPGGFIRFAPGAHLRVKLEVDGREEVRSYSLIDTGVDDGRYRIAVKRIDKGLGGSRYLHTLVVGDQIVVSQPHNQFELNAQASSYTLVAGGIGITALLGMARALAHCPRPVRLHYAVRSRDEAAFARPVRDWLGDRFQLHVSGHGTRLDLRRVVAGIEAQGELYVCGPIGMLDDARRAWQEAARPASLLRFESFASGGHYANRPFTAVLPRFGLEIAVPAEQTLLGALERAGVPMLSDCLRGECGLCAVDVLECDSALDHRDVFMSQAQKAGNRKLCACVSRPVGGRIEIDTDYQGRRLGNEAASARPVS